MVTYGFVLLILCAVFMFLPTARNIVTYNYTTKLSTIMFGAGFTVFYIIATVGFHSCHAVSILVVCAILKGIGCIFDMVIHNAFSFIIDAALLAQLIVVAANLSA